MSTSIEYIANFVQDDPDHYFHTLMAELPFEHREGSPRKECYMNDYLEAYQYGSNGFEKTFFPVDWHPLILEIRKKLEYRYQCAFEVCFVNLYEHKLHSLGWHADDSPEMDDQRPIVSVSLGAERQIWTRENGETDPRNFNRYTLENGSAFVMPPGFQDTHQHRIPKHDRDCGPRLSLTFRGYDVTSGGMR